MVSSARLDHVVTVDKTDEAERMVLVLGKLSIKISSWNGQRPVIEETIPPDAV